MKMMTYTGTEVDLTKPTPDVGHDFHEAYLGDITRPVHEALQYFLPGMRGDIDKELRRMKRLWDPPQQGHPRNF